MAYIWCLPKIFRNPIYLESKWRLEILSMCWNIVDKNLLGGVSATSTHLLQKRLQVKKEPVDTSTKLWTRSRWWSNFPKLFRIDGKKNMKKNNSLGIEVSKSGGFFLHPKIPSWKNPPWLKKNGDWNIHPHGTANSSLGNHHPDALASCDAKIDTFQWTITKGWGSIQEGLEGRKGWMQEMESPGFFSRGKNLYFRAFSEWCLLVLLF